MGAAIYVRLSRDATGEGLGVQRQEKDCRALCKARGWDITEVLVDNDVSAGGKVKRPGYLRLLDLIETRVVDSVVVWHPDRLHRHPMELEHFVALIEDTGCAVATVTAGDWDLATAEGRLVARITGAVARKEYEDKVRRAKRKHAELRERGLVGGPGGYGVSSRSEVVPEEADAIRHAAELLLTGHSLTATCRALTEAGHPTPQGGSWEPTALRRILEAGRVAGLVTHQGKVVGQASWEPILDRVTWERVRQTLDTPPRPPSHGYELTGLLRCECGKTMRGSVHYDRHRSPVRQYVCVRREGGCGATIRAERVEALVSARMAAALADGTLTAPAPLVDVSDDIKAEEAKLAEWARLLDAGQLELVEWAAMRRGVLDRLDALRSQASQVDVSARLERLLATPWDDLDTEERRTLVARFLSVTVLRRGRSSGSRFDPSRVVAEWLD